ncbi:hemerythrin domain-containing protein [Salinicoccus sp. ID82-1]|uniref:Hemerythrin domain-containing protein n=1 Tax=Salinicoccus cyprini TaxID=2493691 RepID=A0A558AR28_9STAP|nr:MULTISPECIES: hemerythrin domain-containing protein [Salinicoccus]MCG1010224.1 hemerythrin domain-containing protein [Salinicoccus sp. ID82-1]TVT26723.1 hemerythrin domain-containing protein [Salinicoccus cyprini]
MDQDKFQFRIKALRVLENEHRYLKYLMDDWFQLVLKFEHGDVRSRLEGLMVIKDLREKLKAFEAPLKRHQAKEENYFFPMLGAYIGLEQGPILSIEEEHQEIDAYIEHFFHHTMHDMNDMSTERMNEMVKDVMEAYEVLMVHMVKEESVLFTMADKVLKTVDEEILLEQVNTLITSA